MPISTVAESDISDIAVRLFITLSSSRCTPPANTFASRVFGVIALDDAHAAQRFRQPAGDFGVDLAALAEDGADGLERLAQDAAPKTEHDREREPVISGLMRSSMTRAMNGGQQPAEELDQTGADQVAHAFHVGHDARDQLAGLVGVVVSDRQPSDVLLHFAAQVPRSPSGLRRKAAESA